jgi:hypothetical protein
MFSAEDIVTPFSIQVFGLTAAESSPVAMTATFAVPVIIFSVAAPVLMTFDAVAVFDRAHSHFDPTTPRVI